MDVKLHCLGTLQCPWGREDQAKMVQLSLVCFIYWGSTNFHLKKSKLLQITSLPVMGVCSGPGLSKEEAVS